MTRTLAFVSILAALVATAWFVLRGDDTVVDSRPAQTTPHDQNDPNAESPEIGDLANRESVGADGGAALDPKQDSDGREATLEGSRIGGRVTDELGRPIVGAALELFAIDGSLIPVQRKLDIVATSAAEGRYEFGELPKAARFRIVGHAEGTALAVLDINAPAIGASLDGVDLRLEPALSIFGKVSNSLGEPVGATVALVRENMTMDTGALATSAQCDPRGEYRLTGLGRGVVRLRADAPGFVSKSVERSLIALTLRREMRVDFTLDSATGELDGRVVASDGAAIANATIEGRADDHVVDTTTGADGHFHLAGLADREYTLNASATGHAGAEAKARPGATDLVVKLASNGGLFGVARLGDGAAPAELAIEVIAIGRQDQLVRRVFVAGAQFEIHDLAPGKYVLWLEAAGGARTRSETFEVASGGRTDCGTIKLSTGGSVVASLDETASGATLVLIAGDISPANPSWSQLAIFAHPGNRLVARGSNARFEHIAPGVYTLFALAEKGLPSIVRDLQVREGETTDAGRISIARGADVGGRILDALGAAQVQQPVVARSSGAPTRAAVSDSEGYFAFSGLEPGDWTFELAPEAKVRGTPRATQAAVEAGSRVEIEIRVYP